MGDFFPGASKINFKPESKARPIFFLDFLPFFFVKLIKIAFFSLSSSKIDFIDNNGSISTRVFPPRVTIV